MNTAECGRSTTRTVLLTSQADYCPNTTNLWRPAVNHKRQAAADCMVCLMHPYSSSHYFVRLHAGYIIPPSSHTYIRMRCRHQDLYVWPHIPERQRNPCCQEHRSAAVSVHSEAALPPATACSANRERASTDYALNSFRPMRCSHYTYNLR